MNTTDGKKRSILRRFWRKISGRTPTETVDQKFSLNWLPCEANRVELPDIAHASSFVSSAGSETAAEDQNTRPPNANAWKRSSLPIAKLDLSKPFRTLADQEYLSCSPSSATGSFKSTTTTIGNDTKVVEIGRVTPPSKQHSKIPRPNRRKTIDLGDTMTRTHTVTDGFYETFHDRGRVKVDIHNPESESPSISPRLANRIPLPSSQLKNKRSSAEVLAKRVTFLPISKHEQVRVKNFVLGSNVPPVSPFVTPERIKRDVTVLDYQLHLPAHVGAVETRTIEIESVEAKQIEIAPRTLMRAPGPPPPMSLPPTPMKNRLRLSFESPPKSPSRIPIATRRRYASQESPPRHVSFIKFDGNRRHSD